MYMEAVKVSKGVNKMLKGGVVYCCWANGVENNKFKRGEYYPIDEVAELDPILDYDRDHWFINDLHPDPVYGVMIGGIVAIFEIKVLEA